MKEFLKTHKYYFVILYIPVYFAAFFLLEAFIVSDYYVCYLPFLDDIIPFNEWFVIAYVIWYPYMAAVGLYLLLKERKEFLRFFVFLFGSMSLCLLICALFPNGQDLRPEAFASDNILTRLVGALYSADTNTNVFPSMHVIASMVTHTAVSRSKTKLFRNSAVRISSLTLCVLICLSTVFIKQHSALDGIAAIALFIPLYFLMYKYDLLFRKKKTLRNKRWFSIIKMKPKSKGAIQMLRIVKTENGLVEGITAADPRITAFKGVPFAAAPVGKLRWKAPQPAENWEGVRKCYEFAPISMQEVPGLNVDNIYSREWHVDPEIPMSEDCLYLNVWTPAKKTDEKLPVMVWIFGGGYQCGYTAEMEFDGERIARRGVILVSVNYRVNAFGFLSHPELVSEDPQAAYGNYGLQDQMYGIQWVKRNIENFGGDPDNITIFGQSAGAGSVLCQMVSPYTKGLFQRAVTQSGGGLRKYGQGGSGITLETALENGKRFFEFLGVKTLDEARAIDEITLRDKANAFGRVNVWGPTIDGRFLPDEPSDMIYRNEYHDIEVMIGNTANEHLGGPLPATVAQLKAYAKENMGKYADEFLKIANVKTDEDVVEFCKRESNVFLGRCLNGLLFLRNQAKYNRKPVYAYYFNPTIPGWDNPGAFHSSELWFVFETLAKCWRPFNGKHYDLARHMCNYWANFAKNGNPNGPDANEDQMSTWERYTEENPFIIFFHEDGACPYENMFTDAMELRIKHIFEEVIEK